MQRMIDRFEDFLVEYPVTDFRLDFDFAYVIFVQITLSSQLQAIPTGWILIQAVTLFFNKSFMMFPTVMNSLSVGMFSSLRKHSGAVSYLY